MCSSTLLQLLSCTSGKSSYVHAQLVMRGPGDGSMLGLQRGLFGQCLTLPWQSPELMSSNIHRKCNMTCNALQHQNEEQNSGICQHCHD